MTATRLGNVAMARRLAQLGAPVNEPVCTLGPESWRTPAGLLRNGDPAFAQPTQRQRRRPQRTALQVAAAKGNLVMVRMLIEESSADDRIISPDGGRLRCGWRPRTGTEKLWSTCRLDGEVHGGGGR